jgi:hypothetical protein
LIIDNGDLLDTAKAAKFVVKVTFGSANAQTKDAENIGRVRGLLLVSVEEAQETT